MTPSAGGMTQENTKGANTSSPSALIELAKTSYRNGKTAADDPLLRDEIIKIMIRQEAFRQNQRRALVPALIDHPMRIPLQNKLIGTEFNQDLAEIAYDIQGAASSLYLNDENASGGGEWQLAYMNSFGVTIAAGANEVQRNILGERVLGMPKSK